MLNRLSASEWSPFEAVRRLPENIAGRDFVVGDVHGTFGLVYAAMSQVGFDPAVDRLLCVGDLIDRGPDSAQVEHFLAHPFVHAVCGNHEAMLLELALTGKPPTEAERARLVRNGMGWWFAMPEDRQEAILSALAQLPLAIETPTPRGSVGLIHADVPAGMSWRDFVAALERDDADAIHACLWGRTRAMSEDPSGVAGIGRLFVGHTVQDGLSRRGNVYALDTGAVFGLTGEIPDGRLTFARAAMGTDAMVAPRLPTLIDIRAGDVPDHAFGQYALAPA